MRAKRVETTVEYCGVELKSYTKSKAKAWACLAANLG